MDEAEFRRDTFLPMRGDVRDQYSEEMNRVISEKALQGQNGLIREKYITISIHEDTYHKAQIRLFKTCRGYTEYVQAYGQLNARDYRH